MAGQGRVKGLLGPWRLIWFSIQVHWDVLKEAVRTHGIAALAHPQRIRDVASARVLLETSEGFIAYEDTTVVPSLVRLSHGKIVEVGTGPGNQIHRYDPSLVEHIYGVDPNARFADAIAVKLKKHPALAKKYKFIACGIEDSDVLAREGVEEGSVDTVLSIQSLCAVDDPRSVMRQVYKLLRPGGSFIFWEHEKSKDTITGIAQVCWNPAWSGFVGCNMNRNITRDILAAGEWENPGDIDESDDPHACLPRIWGELRKKA